MKIPVDRVSPYSYPLYEDYGTRNMWERDNGTLHVKYRLSEIERILGENSSGSQNTG